MIELYKNKKAMEMSLNLIIMLIIGMVIMGLVIGFVTDMVGKGSRSFDTELSKAEEQEQQRVENMPGYFAAGPSILKITPGSSKKVFVKINNIGNSNLEIGGEISGTLTSGMETDTGTTDDGYKLSIEQTLILGTCPLEATAAKFTVNQGDTYVLPIVINAPKGTCKAGDSAFLNIAFYPNGYLKSDSSQIVKTASVSVDIIG